MKKFMHRKANLSRTLLSCSLLAAGLTFSTLASPAAHAIESPEIEVASAHIAHASDIAIDANGNSVVVWLMEESNPTTPPTWHIYGRRYNGSGVAQGDAFRISTTSLNGTQNHPQVAMDSNGNFVVAWTARKSDYDYTPVLRLRRYNASGLSLSEELRFDSLSSPLFDQLSLSMDDAGNFVVVWTKRDAATNDDDVYGQRFNATAVPQGDEFRINTTTLGKQTDADVSMNSSGSFVVSWESEGQDGSGWGVYSQRYNSSGAPQESEFLVNTTTLSDQLDPSVAINDSGNFVVAWTGRNVENTETKIYAQQFDSSGAPQNSELTTKSSYSNNAPSVAMGADGRFFIVWTSFDNNSEGISGQRFNSDGGPQSIPVQVNVKTPYVQWEPNIAMTDDGAAIVSWQSWGWTGADYIDETVSFRRYSPTQPSLAPPNAVDDTIHVLPGQTKNLDVMGNDVYSAFDFPTSIVEFSSAQHGTVQLGDYYGPGSLNLVYTPEPGFVGTDTFTYTLKDSRGETDIATVTLQVKPLPTISIADIALYEGNAGTSYAALRVTLSAPWHEDVTANYQTHNATATAGSDYTAASGTITFKPGETEQYIPVRVVGDTTAEPDETCWVALDNPQKATFSDPYGKVTIRNDEGSLTVSALFANAIEGNTGTSNAWFDVKLSQPSNNPVSITYNTVDWDAKAGSDYVAKTGTLTFNPGQTRIWLPIQLVPDQVAEQNEYFLLKLAIKAPNGSGAIVSTPTTVGVVVNDD